MYRIFRLALICLFFLPQLALADVSNGLVGWWKFTDGSGSTATDSSYIFGATQKDGSLVNSPSWVTGGKIGLYALSFNGSNTYVRVTSNAGTGLDLTSNITMCAWVKANALPGSTFNNYIISRRDSSTGYGYSLLIDHYDYANAQFTGIFVSSSGIGFVTEPTTISTNTWYHVACTFNGSTLKIYLNGQLAGTSASSIVPPSQTNDFLIGIYNNLNSSYDLNGLLNDIRVYNRALSAAEVWDIYEGGSQNYGGD